MLIPSTYRVPDYIDALAFLRKKEQLHQAVLVQTRYRILYVEMEIYNLIIAICLPHARLALINHDLHEQESSLTCACSELFNSDHEKWLLHLTLKIQLLLFSSPNGFQLSSQTYLPLLKSHKVYTYAPPKPRLYLKGEYQQTLNILKEVLYHWLDIPAGDKKAEYRCMMLNYLCSYIGASALFLDGVWNLCNDIPEWIYTDNQEFNSKTMIQIPLQMFATCLYSLPAASQTSVEHQLLGELWQLHSKFGSALRGKGRVSLPSLGISEQLNPVLANHRYQIFKDFLLDSLKATKDELSIRHPMHKRLTDPKEADFYLPLREKAPSRQNLHTQPNSPLSQLREPVGFFNLLLFRVLCFNSETSRTMPFNFTFQSFENFKKLHKREHWYNSRAYGSPNRGRRQDPLVAKYWSVAHHVWPQFLTTMTSTYCSIFI